MSKPTFVISIMVLASCSTGTLSDDKLGTVSSDITEPAMRNTQSSMNGNISEGGTSTVVDSRGKRWIVRRARTTDSPSEISNEPFDNSVLEKYNEDTHDFGATKFVDGMEYQEVGVSEKSATARRAFKSKVRGYLAPYPNGGVPLDPMPQRTPSPVIPSESVGEPTRVLSIIPFDISTNEALQIGADNRLFWPTGSLSWVGETARSAHVSLSGCSGTMIGGFTAISAAHCFYNRAAGAWNTARINGSWGLGQIRSSTSANPTNFVTTYTFGPQSGCMNITIPTNYITNPSEGGAQLDDFAIVEFTCGLRPGAGGNSYPPCYGIDNDYTSASTSTLSAYDGSGASLLLPGGMPVPQNWAPGTNFQLSTMIVRGSQAPGVSIINSVLINGNLNFDATAGSSGGGLVSTIFSSVGDFQMCWTGSVIGPSTVQNIVTGTTSSRLTFRRLTAGTWGFIVDNSTEF